MASPSTYRTPGVYVEWLDTNAQRLEIARTDVAGFVGLAERGPVQAPAKIESVQQFRTTFGDPVPGSHLALAVGGFFANGGRTCWVVRAADPAGARAASLGVALPGRDPFVLLASSPGGWGNAVSVAPVWGRDRVEALAVTAPGRALQRIDLDALSAPPSRANLLGIRDDLLPDLAPDLLVAVIPVDASDPSPSGFGAGSGPQRLEGGDDGIGAISVDHLVGDRGGADTWGVAALERVPGVALVAVPDLMLGRPATLAPGGPRAFADADVIDAQFRIVASCARCRDRVAVLDLPPGDRQEALAYRAKLPRSPAGTPGAPASFAAAYHPWLVVNDPANGDVRPLPPSGHVVGLCARVDRLRGVHKPPANEVVEAACDLTEALDDAAHADLNDAGLNALRAIPGRGLLVLGARTLSDDFPWRYVNIRRLFAMVEVTLESQMQWLTFEPNAQRLWREVDRALRGFLQRLFRAGMLDGASEDDAFFVRCDETTNPPTEVDAGKVTCLVGLQPPYPAEFVVVRIGVTRNGIEVEEKGAQDA